MTGSAPPVRPWRPDEPDLVGETETDTDDTLDPEEEAMRVVDDPPGASYGPNPGYVEDEPNEQH